MAAAAEARVVAGEKMRMIDNFALGLCECGVVLYVLVHKGERDGGEGRTNGTAATGKTRGVKPC